MILELQQHWKKLFSTCPRYYDCCTSPVVTIVIWGIHLRSVAMAYSHWVMTCNFPRQLLGQLDFFNDHVIHIMSTVNMVINWVSSHDNSFNDITLFQSQLWSYVKDSMCITEDLSWEGRQMEKKGKIVVQPFWLLAPIQLSITEVTYVTCRQFGPQESNACGSNPFTRVKCTHGKRLLLDICQIYWPPWRGAFLKKSKTLVSFHKKCELHMVFRISAFAVNILESFMK